MTLGWFNGKKKKTESKVRRRKLWANEITCHTIQFNSSASTIMALECALEFQLQMAGFFKSELNDQQLVEIVSGVASLHKSEKHTDVHGMMTVSRYKQNLRILGSHQFLAPEWNELIVFCLQMAKQHRCEISAVVSKQLESIFVHFRFPFLSEEQYAPFYPLIVDSHARPESGLTSAHMRIFDDGHSFREYLKGLWNDMTAVNVTVVGLRTIRTKPLIDLKQLQKEFSTLAVKQFHSSVPVPAPLPRDGNHTLMANKVLEQQNQLRNNMNVNMNMNVNNIAPNAQQSQFNAQNHPRNHNHNNQGMQLNTNLNAVQDSSQAASKAGSPSSSLPSPSPSRMICDTLGYANNHGEHDEHETEGKIAVVQEDEEEEEHEEDEEEEEEEDDVGNQSNLKVNNNGLSICQEQFHAWFTDVIQFPQYLQLFVENEMNDMRFCQYFDDNCLQSIGISKSMHRKLIIKRSQTMAELQLELDGFLDANVRLKRYHQELETHGILTIKDLQVQMNTKAQMQHLLQVQKQAVVNDLWNIIQSTFPV